MSLTIFLKRFQYLRSTILINFIGMQSLQNFKSPPLQLQFYYCTVFCTYTLLENYIGIYVWCLLSPGTKVRLARSQYKRRSLMSILSQPRIHMPKDGFQLTSSGYQAWLKQVGLYYCFLFMVRVCTRNVLVSLVKYIQNSTLIK